MAAKRKEIKEIAISDLGVSDADASGIQMHKIYVPVKTKETVVLEGDTADIVSKLIDKLKNEAKVL